MYGSSLPLKKISAILAGCMGVIALLIMTLSMNAPRTVAEDAEIFVEPEPVQTVADLSVTRSGPASVMRGTNLTSMFTVHNNGPSAAESVTLNVLLFGDMTYVSASAGGCSFNGDIGQVVCTLGTMNSGENRTVSLTFSVNTTANCQTGEADNSASVSADSEDGDIANNLTQDVITIECPSQSAQQSSSSSPAAFVPPPPPPPAQQPASGGDFDVDTYVAPASATAAQPQQSGVSSSTASSQASSAPKNGTITSSAVPAIGTATSAAPAPVPVDGQVVFSAPGMTCHMVGSALHCEMGPPDFSQGSTSIQRSFQSPSSGSNGQPFNPFSDQ